MDTVFYIQVYLRNDEFWGDVPVTISGPFIKLNHAIETLDYIPELLKCAGIEAKIKTIAIEECVITQNGPEPLEERIIEEINED